MAKKTKKPIGKKTKVVKLPSAWSLTQKAYKEAATFWRSLIGVLSVYAVLYFVLVMGFNLSLSWQQGLALSGSKISQAVSGVFSVFGSGALSGGSQTDATTIIQFILFLIASLAFIWAIRRLQALKDVKIRDAYYLGNASLIPVMLVSFALLITLIPAAIGSGLLSASLQVSTTGTEIFIVSIIAGVLLLISLYFLSMFWSAFYIASLPETRPWQALRSAAQITKKRRFAILRKISFFAILNIIILFIVLFLVALAAASIVPFVVFLLLIILFALAHIYLYSLYRSLL